MNEKRQKALDDWWLLHATEDQRMTPAEIWNAACDWMKEEILWEFEKCTGHVRNDRED
jgi:hypothetical protein